MPRYRSKIRKILLNRLYDDETEGFRNLLQGFLLLPLLPNLDTIHIGGSQVERLENTISAEGLTLALRGGVGERITTLLVQNVGPRQTLALLDCFPNLRHLTLLGDGFWNSSNEEADLQGERMALVRRLATLRLAHLSVNFVLDDSHPADAAEFFTAVAAGPDWASFTPLKSLHLETNWIGADCWTFVSRFSSSLQSLAITHSVHRITVPTSPVTLPHLCRLRLASRSEAFIALLPSFDRCPIQQITFKPFHGVTGNLYSFMNRVNRPPQFRGALRRIVVDFPSPASTVILPWHMIAFNLAKLGIQLVCNNDHALPTDFPPGADSSTWRQIVRLGAGPRARRAVEALRNLVIQVERSEDLHMANRILHSLQGVWALLEDQEF